MPDPNSPAVASLHEEQARQRSGESNLQEGLEETFPASDPVSHTSTTTATSSGAADAAEDETETPKVDEALAAVKARYDQSSSDFATDELRALSAELDRIAESAQGMASASGRIARSEVHSLRRTIVRQVRKNPVQSLGLAALVGYVWGIMR
ncbi:hypothetical protein [uncultured Agrobacterium sp.]|uniref:hypothetical protein n=1 Tax=uncultured Agrobacterium sp. TaxID=157277 RepID=UPI002588136C|nr:hypothetical protein [uncultured Agrobacterium sp.]